MLSALRTAAGVAFALAIATDAVAQYANGFVWRRADDYTIGTVHGSSLGNPNLDTAGNPVWEMGWTGYGNRLGEAGPPWYEGAVTLSVHDSNWYGSGPAWAQGDDTGAVIIPSLLQQGLNNGGGIYLPVVRWINPVSEPFELDIVGTLRVDWSGFGSAPNSDIDVALVHLDSVGNYTPLFAMTFVKPTPGTAIESSAPEPISLLGVDVQPGDSILLGLQTRTQGLGSNWIDLYDDLTFSIPSAASVPASNRGAIVVLVGLLLGGGLGARRKREPGPDAAHR